MILLQLLLQYAKKTNLDLGQAGYQAVAKCCLKEKEGIELLQEMRVSVYDTSYL